MGGKEQFGDPLADRLDGLGGPVRSGESDRLIQGADRLGQRGAEGCAFLGEALQEGLAASEPTYDLGAGG